MSDVELASTGERVSDDRGELQELLQSCGHWMLLCKPGVTPDLAAAQPVVDVKADGATPAFDMFAAIAERVVAGETVLVACRAAMRSEKVASVAQRLGWHVLPVADREFQPAR